MATDGSKVRSVAVVQSLIYSIQDKISADIRTKFISTFETPNGISKLSTQGQLILNQKENYAQGHIERQMDFDGFQDLEFQLRN